MVVDYLGNEFKSISAMCRHYNIARHVYDKRVRLLGWDLKDALTTEVTVSARRCIDHEGNEFDSIKEMARHWNISYDVLRERIHSNTMDIKDCILRPVQVSNIQCIDHKGVRYSSISQMCKSWNVTRKTFLNRIKNGWSIEDALTIKPKIKNIKCCDHLGNWYESERKMCKHYNISRATFKNRINNGLPLKDALTLQPNFEHISTDHLGNTYDTATEMCNFWHVNYDVYKTRISDGWTKEDALLCPRKLSLGEHKITKILNDKNIEYLHDITIKAIFKHLGCEEKYNDFVEKLYNVYCYNNVPISKETISKMRYDFTIIKSGNIFAFIEFDGVQHFKLVHFFTKTLIDFFHRHSKDEIKTTFAEQNNISLLRIRYDQINMCEGMIDDLLQEPKKYINNHNTYLTEEEYWSIFDFTH